MLPRKIHQLARSCVPAGDVIAWLPSQTFLFTPTQLYGANLSYLPGILSDRSIRLMFMQLMVFFLCRHPSPDVPLRLIDIKYLSRLRSKRGIDLHHPLCDIFMYSTFRHPKLFRSLTHRGAIFYYIVSDLNSALFDI